MDITAANPAGADADEKFSRLWLGHGQLRYDQPAIIFQQQRFHGIVLTQQLHCLNGDVSIGSSSRRGGTRVRWISEDSDPCFIPVPSGAIG
jgi:hypothetical protein